MLSSWTVGEAEIVRVDAANFTLPAPGTSMPPWAVPMFTPAVDEAPLAFSALAIRMGETAVVVDPWIVDDSPRSRPDAATVVTGLCAELASAGVWSEAVEVVVGSHIDGIGWHTRPGAQGWEPTFPRARYLFPADELAAVDRGVEVNGAEHLGPLEDAGVIERVEPPYEIVPGVSLVDAPGHNDGHVAVRVESGDALAVYAGHLILSLLQVDDPGYDAGDTDLAVATRTRRAILGELAERRGLLLTTLIGGAGCGYVEACGSGFRLVAT